LDLDGAEAMKTEKIALVTGANKGIGFEITRQLASSGFQVFLTARHSQRGEEACSKLQTDGLNVEFLQLRIDVGAKHSGDNIPIFTKIFYPNASPSSSQAQAG
jgi:short-subunit dehydrogenase